MWHAEYVALDDKDVLIVVVDPPNYGDPIHYLRRSLPSPKEGEKYAHAEHTVFIRKNARTLRAAPEDWRMLQQRFAATQNRLDVEVLAAPQEIQQSAAFSEHVKLHLAQHRERLLAARHPLGVMNWESRTREEYVAEIDSHLERLQECFVERLLAELLRHPPSGLSLTLANQVDRPFRDVRVTVTVQAEGHLACPGPVDEELPKFELPRPPRPYGAPKEPVLAFDRLIPYTPEIRLPFVLGLEGFCGWGAREISTGLQLEFDPVDLRPREALELPRVPLLVTSEVGSELTVEWSAAGLSADGIRSGHLNVQVVPSTLNPLRGEDLGKWGHEPLEQDSTRSTAE
ncbi:hypothetical protein ACGFNU_47515 [Spirillospora sp. NPDC048911]|uniref:hypothetical protein n=1 Tax=Spirillospora sp. NPDC048911 TaxID=3364527 RepID=UPI00371F826A